jgi:hypothetical protein
MKEQANWTAEVLKQAHVTTVSCLTHDHLGLIESEMIDRLGTGAFNSIDREIEAVLDDDARSRNRKAQVGIGKNRPASKDWRLRWGFPDQERLIVALSNGASSLIHRYGEIRGVTITFDKSKNLLQIRAGN